ncbi:hypothetical protein BBM13_20415 [Vibrio parahaemolyticus]|nr:hypothetical protein BBM12_12285 [Vibrio parahaemolyticus]ODX85779.1 hypothetical protein BBM13_20415 [Vibrio parahaemolyticus]ODX87134.1 hypothetical protein BBM93_12285 [Vibrio parahaemolyticus]ODX97434.1 hypothetical protein BBM14_16375 [Vibrio parahaemolyticus]ODY04515.1 hypothetical protein BBM95_07815 [Vibrio parahaemolyticus]
MFCYLGKTWLVQYQDFEFLLYVYELPLVESKVAELKSLHQQHLHFFSVPKSRQLKKLVFSTLLFLYFNLERLA